MRAPGEGIGSQSSIFIDRRKDRTDGVSLTQLVVFHAVARSNMHEPRSRIRGDEVGGEDRRLGTLKEVEAATAR